MNRIVTLVTAALLFASASSCVPVLVGGMIHKSIKSQQERQEFIAEFNETNQEREAAGLEPLDFCTEARRFDAAWANDLPECKESGDR